MWLGGGRVCVLVCVCACVCVCVFVSLSCVALQVEAEFARIDTNGGGIVLFDEFVGLGLKKQLDLEDDDDWGREREPPPNRAAPLARPSSATHPAAASAHTAR